jgi:predicted nucleotidyltransferase
MGPELTPDGKGIGAALFGAARQAVLRILYGHADRRFYRRQLIRLLGVGNGAVQRELARLTQTGILTRTVEGRQTYFQANSQCPVFAEIRDLSRKTFGVADVLREALQPLTGSVRLAFVYGSVAAGTEKSDSDIDVMAVGDLLSLDEVVTALAPAQSSLGREVNPSVYETGEFCRRLAEGKHFISSVVAGPKVFLKGDQVELNGLAQVRMDPRAPAQQAGDRGPVGSRRPRS